MEKKNNYYISKGLNFVILLALLSVKFGFITYFIKNIGSEIVVISFMGSIVIFALMSYHIRERTRVSRALHDSVGHAKELKKQGDGS